jgi:adenylate cyclase
MATRAPDIRPKQDRFRNAVLIASLVVLTLAAVRPTSLWADINGRMFDVVSTTAPATPAEPGVIIVAIDEPSFSEIGLQWPWPRSVHADLLTALEDAGAKAVAVDVVFSEATNSAEDQALGQAAADITVYASDETLLESNYGSQLIRTEPAADIMAFGAKVGVASVATDADGVLRTLPTYPDGLARTLLQIAIEETHPNAADQNTERLIQYFGPSGSYPRVSYYQALNPSEFLPDNYFKDKVVMVGYALQTVPLAGSSTTDAYETPYTMKTGQLSYGAEIHATIFDNFKHGLSILKPHNVTGYLLLLLGGVAGFATARLQSWGVKAALGLSGVCAIFLLSWLALKYGRVWLSPWEPAIGLSTVLAALSVRDFSIERRMRRDIQGAFSQYLSPHMVADIVKNPAQLTLGGERKTLTLMFADIRGFTTLSEHFKDDPQGLTQLVNDILTPLSDIIMSHGGTIDKYIGDCIMAFWNAPLDDPDHAAHALAAARDMVASLDRINADIKSQLTTLTDIDIRIGIGLNTGDCVVGNMGSKTRFDYSVLGDPVNVAARLEGLTKDYGTPIIFGEAVFEQLIDTQDTYLLGDIQVRGREQSLKIYSTALPTPSL